MLTKRTFRRKFKLEAGKLATQRVSVGVAFVARKQALRARARICGLPKDRGERFAEADNVLARQFQAESSNQKWVLNVTQIWTAEGWLPHQCSLAA